MRAIGSRTITINKEALITQIKKNKKEHVKMYKKAVIAFKKEALADLEEIIKEVHKGELVIKIDLVTPIDNSKNYDKIAEMFEWEIDEEVKLTQSEFKEYVQDEGQDTQYAMTTNSMYLS